MKMVWSRCEVSLKLLLDGIRAELYYGPESSTSLSIAVATSDTLPHAFWYGQEISLHQVPSCSLMQKVKSGKVWDRREKEKVLFWKEFQEAYRLVPKSVSSFEVSKLATRGQLDSGGFCHIFIRVHIKGWSYWYCHGLSIFTTFVSWRWCIFLRFMYGLASGDPWVIRVDRDGKLSKPHRSFSLSQVFIQHDPRTRKDVTREPSQQSFLHIHRS